KSTNPEISGFHDVLSAEGYETVPLFAGRAITSGPVRHADFEQIKSLLVEQVREAGPLDALLLALHGAMCAEGTYDCEGAILSSLREAFGKELPLVITLDPHANITRQIVDNADAVIGFKTYPHVDM